MAEEIPQAPDSLRITKNEALSASAHRPARLDSFPVSHASAPPKAIAPLNSSAPALATPLAWIETAKDAPYFVTETGDAWTPVGHNDAVSWVDLAGLFRGRDLRSVDDYLRMLSQSGVTVLRLMLECAHQRHRYLERPIGRFVPAMVKAWDDLFALCERHGLRLLLTPYDTFWTWVRWRHHPLNRANGGICAKPGQLLLCAETRRAIKQRLSFAVERWAGSGALFAWDLWNEIHPAHAADRDDCVDVFNEFIADLSDHVRRLELRLYGRAHPQTVSLFGPELEQRAHLPLSDAVFRHPELDFASIHIYKTGTIDDPRNTVAPAIDTGHIVRRALSEIRDGRPFLDTEHGPIHRFKDKKKTLPEAFDDEYFRHMQWAHLASGGAGGGMRWPNRSPHRLTPGMRRAQSALSAFLPLIDWTVFARRNLNDEIRVSGRSFARFACGDEEQAIVWLLRTDSLDRSGMVGPRREAELIEVSIPSLRPGNYQVTSWDTAGGMQVERFEVAHAADALSFRTPTPLSDCAYAVRRVADSNR